MNCLSYESSSIASVDIIMMHSSCSIIRNIKSKEFLKWPTIWLTIATAFLEIVASSEFGVQCYVALAVYLCSM